MDEDKATVSVVLDGEEVELPFSLLEHKAVFSGVLSVETWRECLSAEERARLSSLLPDQLSAEEALEPLFSGENIKFGNPVNTLWKRLHRGELLPEVQEAQRQLRELKLQQYKLQQKSYHVHLLQEVLLSRQVLLQKALFAGSPDAAVLPERRGRGRGRGEMEGGAGRLGRRSGLDRRAQDKYRQILSACRKECGQEEDGFSSDEDFPAKPTNQGSAEPPPPPLPGPVTEEDYYCMLRRYKKERRRKKSEPEPVLWVEGENGGKSEQPALWQPASKKREALDLDDSSLDSFPSKYPRLEQEVGGDIATPPSRKVREGKDTTTSERGGGAARERRAAKKAAATSSAGGGGGGGAGLLGGLSPERTTVSDVQDITNAYAAIDAGTVKEQKPQPIWLDGPLPQGSKFLCYFSVVREAFEQIQDKKGEISKITKNVRDILRSAEVSGCGWLGERRGWVELTLSAMCYLAGEVGAVSSFEPLSHFIPLVEFKDRIDHWKWIGHNRDSELELLVLCNHWIENMHRTLTIVDYSDYEPPPPHRWTSQMFRQSSLDEVQRFRDQEVERYQAPHKAYIYSIHGFESPVGPVKGSRATKKDTGSRARGHALLVPNRPNCITILSLVRDATSRMPNGEGTRIDLCVLVRDSQYLAETVSDTQLNNAVSGALDRLHYEKDPCVRYDNVRKVWIYLHRGRTEEEFERIYWACEVASKQRKILMARPKFKPKIMLKEGSQEVVLEPGSSPKVADGSSESGQTSSKSCLTSSKSSLSSMLRQSAPTATATTTATSFTGKKPVAKTGQTGVAGGVLLQTQPKSTVVRDMSPSFVVVHDSTVAGGRGLEKTTPTPLILKAVHTTTTAAHREGGKLKEKERRGDQTPLSTAARLSSSSSSTASSLHRPTPPHPPHPLPSQLPQEPLPSFQESDWESSDEEEMPFLDSSRLPPTVTMATAGGVSMATSRGSTSSWNSTDSEESLAAKKGRGVVSATPSIPTPNFLAGIDEGAAGQLVPGGVEEEGEEGGAGGFGLVKTAAPGWLSPMEDNGGSGGTS